MPEREGEQPASASDDDDVNNNVSNKIDNTKPPVLRIAVGSTNPTKLKAVQQAMERRYPDLYISGYDVESNVSDQPVGDEETKCGAKNRAQAAYLAYKQANPQNKPPHFAIGIEGGLEYNDLTSTNDDNDNGEQMKNGQSSKQQQQNLLYCMAWMAIYGRREAVLVRTLASPDTTTYSDDKRPIFGLAKTAIFQIPNEITKLVESGLELGHADDHVFDRTNSKHKSGTVGILTDGLIDRTMYYEHAILLALIPWIRPDLYPHGNS